MSVEGEEESWRLEVMSSGDSPERRSAGSLCLADRDISEIFLWSTWVLIAILSRCEGEGIRSGSGGIIARET
jgi:hypothetical protein